jgi:beta-glucosidase
LPNRFITPLIWAKVIKADERHVDLTEMNWEVYPESIYEMLIQFSKYQNFKEIIVTENGAAFPDVQVGGKIHDIKRIEFLKQYLNQVLRAKNQGVNVTGYFVWSFTDNFEWAEGYRPRFGLVYVDFKTQERIIKDSGFWFSEMIKKS